MYAWVSIKSEWRSSVILTGPEIKKEVRRGRIVISPFDESFLGPNSYDLHLDPEFKLYSYLADVNYESPGPYSCPRYVTGIDPKVRNKVHTHRIPKEGMEFRPGVLHLGSTVEIAGSSTYVPMLEGVSSVARLGLQIHKTAGFGDIGFEGRWTLEMSVVNPVVVYPNMRIAQVFFLEPKGKIKLYSGKYLGQKGPVESKMYKEYTRER